MRTPPVEVISDIELAWRGSHRAFRFTDLQSTDQAS